MSADSVPSSSRDLPELEATDAATSSASGGAPTRKPMPRWMPYAAAALLVSFVGAAAFPILSRVSSGTAVSPDPGPTAMLPSVDAPTFEDQLAAAREATDALARQQEQAELALEASLAALRRDLASVSEDVRALRAAAEADRLKVRDVAPTSARDTVQAAIDSLALQLDGIVASSSKPQAALPARQRPRRVAVRPPAPPPFDVLAIDVWGGEPQLTIRDGAGVRHVTPGQSVVGWRLIGAEAGGAAVTLQDPRGRTTRYTLAGTTLATVPAATGPLPTLTVAAEPADARIRVMNIGPAYHDRMPLPPGAYDVLVDRHGYEPARQWVRLDADRVLTVRLAPAAGAAESTR